MVTKTQTRDEAELEMLRLLVEADKAPETPQDGVISKGDESKNQPPIAATLGKSAGNVWLRRNSDGKLVQVNRNNLRMYMAAKFPDGRPQFLPRTASWTGKTREPRYWCPLSANHPDRPKMDDLNLEVCTKRGMLMTEAAVRRHLMKKHKDAFDSIQRDREDRRQDTRDRHAADMAVALQSALAGKKAASKIRADEDGDLHLDAASGMASAPAVAAEVFKETCPVCSEVFESKVKVAAKNKLRSHQLKVHQEGG
jgi:hypothetical protein